MECAVERRPSHPRSNNQYPAASAPQGPQPCFCPERPQEFFLGYAARRPGDIPITAVMGIGERTMPICDHFPRDLPDFCFTGKALGHTRAGSFRVVPTCAPSLRRAGSAWLLYIYLARGTSLAPYLSASRLFP
jgi:hypothetical protein